LRTTLFWEANLKFSGNLAKVDFFTSDKLSEYLILVEGISGNGKIFSKTERIIVDKKQY
jgi:hypothetical protein